MLGDFRFFGNPESRLLTMVAEDLQVRRLARAVVSALQTVETYHNVRPLPSPETEVAEFIRLSPLANMLYCIVEVRVAAGFLGFRKT